jgi:murein DD-endopeptidase MepM/ murein hydrolase activator NlpD
MNYKCGIFSLFLAAAIAFFAAFPIAAEDVIHVVVKGDTVYSISRTYRVSQDELMRHNGISDASRLQLGSRLRIPNRPAAPAAGTQAGTAGIITTTHRVVRNDTLFSLARTHGITVQRLREINGFSADYVIKIGENIRVPAPAAALAVNPPTPPTSRPVPDGDARKTASVAIDTSVRWPVKPKEIAYMTGKLYGVAVVGERSEAVRSLTHGTVISAGPYRGFGRVVIVEVPGGYLYVYGGCESLTVKEGDKIVPGMELGKLGVDAVSGKPQLFFMVYQSNNAIDPAKAPRA